MGKPIYGLPFSYCWLKKPSGNVSLLIHDNQLHAHLGRPLSLAVEDIDMDTGQITSMRSITPTYPEVGQRSTVASPASSSTATELRSPIPTKHVTTAPVRGALTYRAPGRWRWRPLAVLFVHPRTCGVHGLCMQFALRPVATPRRFSRRNHRSS